MRCRVFEQLHLIMSARDDFAFANNDCADRYFARLRPFARHTQCFTHEIFITTEINHH